MRLLATKIVSFNFKDRLVQNNFSVVENEFIEILPLKITINSLHEHVLFTSQNAVRLAFKNSSLQGLLNGKKTYCVGEKTASLLAENGQKVVKIVSNASELAHFLSKKLKNESFSFICGVKRMTDLENHFAAENMTIKIHEIYDTESRPKKIAGHYDGILFFSPSTVHSFFTNNSVTPSTHCFCIGTTTAKAVSQYTDKYSSAKQPNEQHLLLSIRNYFSKNYDKK